MVNEKIIFFDIGAKGGIFNYLKKYQQFLEVYASEPNPDEASLLKDLGYNIISNGIAGKTGKRYLNVTRDSGSSSILNPKSSWRKFILKNSGQLRKIDIIKKLSMDCISINDIEFSNPLDFLKVDVQGLEFEILDNMTAHKPIFIITEVSFIPLYENQGTFSDIDISLRNKGYICILLDSRKVRYNSITKFKYYPNPGTIRHCDAWFVPSWLDEKGLKIIFDNDKKFAALLLMHGFHDLVVQIFKNIDTPNKKHILNIMLKDINSIEKG